MPAETTISPPWTACGTLTTEATEMNKHGIQAQKYWSDQLPGRYAQIEDPETFFAHLGTQAEAEIEDRYLLYSEPEVPEESAEDKEARLIQAMSRATEEVYAELVTPSPASQGEPDPEDTGILPAS
jgi:hypothetical protein